MTERQPGGFEQQVASAIHTVQTLCAVLALALAGALGLAIWGHLRLSGDEQRTCRIQARGLPAGHQLAASMGDIHKLLTAPLTPEQKREQRAESPRVRAIVADLNTHLARYQAAESRQPGTRPC